MIIRTSSIFAFLVLLMIESAADQALVKPGCRREFCGNVSIPYPFGIGTDCYMDKGFEVYCNASKFPRIILNGEELEVLYISLDPSFISIKLPINCTDCGKILEHLSPYRSPFESIWSTFDEHYDYVPGVLEWAITEEDVSKLPRTNESAFNCSGFPGINDTIDTIDYAYHILFRLPFLPTPPPPPPPIFGPPGTVASSASPSSPPKPPSKRCVCERGFQGNPYLPHGCHDIDECKDAQHNSMCSAGSICVNKIGSYTCKPKQGKKALPIILGISLGFGVVCLLIGTYWLHKILKKRRKKNLQMQFFKENGGLLLQQQLSSTEGNIERTKIFSTKELEKATDNFNSNRILGQGGQGTVYKGMLVDGRIVAVKKSKVLDKEKVKEFINEVVILTQINHRNIVKLLGCCLETEVPLLVYEYIPNGTLFQYIHDGNEDFPLTWERRLTIAAEVAAALSYLHSAASIPIYHRDVKSSNILLDEKYKAKVSDFGTSRSIAIDQTHLTTNVHGTFGYLDPEYYQSSQFTEKSDVYSFGVVLVELLTGEKPISLARAEGGRSLAAHFIHSMEDNSLFSILDAQVRESSAREDITKVAKLAHRCLNLNGKMRPKMIEVATELEQIHLLQNNSNGQQNHEEVTYVKSEVTNLWDGTSTSIGSGLDSGAVNSFDDFNDKKTIGKV
ncbi:hypothetical protein SLE2022_380410 [Rubroshorea leprosula]